MSRESYAALAAWTWMGSMRGKKPKEIEESLSELLDRMHASGYEAAEEHLATLTAERDSARADARILAHAYTRDSMPPSGTLARALAYPVMPEGRKP